MCEKNIALQLFCCSICCNIIQLIVFFETSEIFSATLRCKVCPSVELCSFILIIIIVVQICLVPVQYVAVWCRKHWLLFENELNDYIFISYPYWALHTYLTFYEVEEWWYALQDLIMCDMNIVNIPILIGAVKGVRHVQCNNIVPDSVISGGSSVPCLELSPSAEFTLFHTENTRTKRIWVLCRYVICILLHLLAQRTVFGVAHAWIRRTIKLVLLFY